MLCRFCPPDGAVRGVRVVTGVERGTKGPVISYREGGYKTGGGGGGTAS